MKATLCISRLLLCTLLCAALVLGMAQPRAAAEEPINRVTLCRELGEEAQTLLWAAEGPLDHGGYFSYEVASDVRHMWLYCEHFADGQKLDETLLIDHDFTGADVDAPRHGEIFISGTHGYVSFTDRYEKDVEVRDKDGTVLELLERQPVFSWDEAALPLDVEVLTTGVCAVFDGVTEPEENVQPGVPVEMLLFVMCDGTEQREYIGKTADVILQEAPACEYYVFTLVFDQTAECGLP